MSNGHRSGRSTGRITTTEPDMTFFNFIIIFLTPVLNSQEMKKIRHAIQKSTKIKLEWTLTESRFLPHEVYETNKSSILRVFTFQKRDFLRFLKWRVKNSYKVVSKSLVLNPSKWVHILRWSVTSIIHQGLSLVFPNNWLLKRKSWLGYDANIIT